MQKNNLEVLAENKKLKEDNAALRRKLREVSETIHTIKSGNIDALVISDKKDLKVYSEKTADKTYRILIEKMHEGAVTLNEDGIILYCNSFFAKMVNLPLQKVIGLRLANFIQDSSKERFEVLIKKGVTKAVKEEVYISINDKEVMPVLMSVNMLTLENDFVLSIILTDITVQNKNQEILKSKATQLEQKNKELEKAYHELAFQIKEKEKRTAELSIANTDVKERDELIAHKESILAILSHDLRSPLAGIIGTAKHLSSNFETMEPDTVKMMLALLYKSSIDELNMLDYLVEWARVKFASETFLPEKILLPLYVKKVFDTLNENAVANKITLQNEINENTNVFADGKMMLSVLQNIISNAIKHTRPGGRITVTATGKEDKVIVQIKDSGIGMSKEIKEKLFTPQMQSLSLERKENKGAGIGLLLARSFVEKNGGEIWVESVEGEGSSFYFTLPVNKTFAKINNAKKQKLLKVK